MVSDLCFGRAKAVYGMQLRRDDIIIQFAYASLHAFPKPVNGDKYHPDVYKTLKWHYNPFHKQRTVRFIVGNFHPTWDARSVNLDVGQMALEVSIEIYVRCSHPPCMRPRTHTRLLASLPHEISYAIPMRAGKIQT